MVVFLEANNDGKLLKYYNDNRFSQFDTRQTTSKDQEPHELVQVTKTALIKYFIWRKVHGNKNSCTFSINFHLQ